MTIGADTIRQLRQAHRGDIILPGDVHYESGRRVVERDDRSAARGHRPPAQRR